MEKQRSQMGEVVTDSAVARAQKAKEFWQIVQDKLGEFNTTAPIRFYIEGNDQLKEFTAGEIDPEFEAIKDTLPPEERVISEFMQRVGGTLMPTEDPELIRAQLAITSQVDDLLHKADEEDKLLEERNASRDEALKSAADLLRELFSLGRQSEEIKGRRDEHIAESVITSLSDDGIGFLFLGGEHDVESRLPDDIKRELLDERLPEIIREATQIHYQDEDDEDEPLEPFQPSGETKG